ncbi:helix-turn-helix transcriptional regulator [Pseudochelatococcus sp. G4_1912]|uniref:helix-turn-helix transcriptional regulator n=1 Tax=Pseudochelatococcus sp. G4_1912 TaxID=3114288 RepID=UPI0039C759FF
MSLTASERLEYIYDNNGKILLLNNNERIRWDGSLVMRCADPVNFNRVCGPLVSAMANPDDSVFSAEVGISSDLLSVSATFARQVRHGASPQDLRHPAIVLILLRKGEALLRVGGTVVPLDVAMVSSDVDFTIRATEPGGTCTVSYIMLMGAPDLVARMPRPLIVPKTTRNMAPDNASPDNAPYGRQALREFGERTADWVSENHYLSEYEVFRFSELFKRLLREHFDHGEWIDQGAGVGCEIGMTTGNGRDIISMVQRYLRQNSSDADVTPGRIARHCAVSVRKLYNAFAMADMSLRATVLSYRLEEARRQLNGRMVKKVTSIAYDAGFRDVSTFYRNFRREFGYSPRNNVVNDLQQESALQERDKPDADSHCVNAGSAHAMPFTSVMPNNSQAGGMQIGGIQENAGEGVLLPRDTLFRNHASRPANFRPHAPNRLRAPS